MPEIIEQDHRTGVEVAIIGMAGRFPGASNIHEFWNNLKNGVESITFFSDKELDMSVVDPGLAKEPKFVKSNGGFFEDKECFDAWFFDYTPKEAELMAPQMRILHECAWEALEDAGYNSYAYGGLIGIYAGGSSSSGWEEMTILSGKRDEMGGFASTLLVDKDFLSTRVAYKLNFRGPAVALQTACSTSLVALHMACQALLDGECDMALAGGAKVSARSNVGYLYQEGMTRSPDGHCRAFDEKAKGTAGGDGAGIVVLKSLQDAIDHRDHIHAVIKGTAINNDGIIKAGFTAPSREGQTEVIRVALQVAEVESESIGYMETHGTGTAIGDPIEIEALQQAFDTDKKGICAIGSVKTNIGHLDVAAGIAGLIKTVLALKYKCIPPSLHYEKPNPKIDFENSPFYVNTVVREWKRNGGPLRAGVSSFGIGGTNAHVVIEEAPVISHSSLVNSETRREREHQLMLLSAKTPSALDKITENLARYLKNNTGISLADAAYTLQVGRRALPHRRMFVCSTKNQAVEALTADSPGMLQTFYTKIEDRPIIFMFPGQGAQYVNMGWDLYRTDPVFREEMDRCFEILKSLMDVDIKEILYPSFMSNRSNRSYMTNINQTKIAQPVLVAFEYALARLLMKWGIKPFAMIGHSIGEYVAAYFSGVFSLEDALTIAMQRGKLMQKMRGGAMLSVSLSQEDLKPLLIHEELALAVVNGPSHCVVSGPHQAIDAFAQQLRENGHQCRKLHTSHAFHSKMMEPIIEQFEEKVKEITLHRPIIPYISNVTGQWITVSEAVSPGYWSTHLRKTVRFADGANQLLEKENAVFVEIGPGKTLSTFVRAHPRKTPEHIAINLVRHPKEKVTDDYYLLSKIGQLWLFGKPVDWQEYYSREKRYHVALPTYPFEGQHYWISPTSFKMNKKSLMRAPRKREKKDISDWFYIPSWKRTGAATFEKGKKFDFSNVLIFIDDTDVGPALAKGLEQEGKTVFKVKAGTGFAKENDSVLVINPKESSHYNALFKELKRANKVPECIIHLWSLTANSHPFGETSGESFAGAQYLGFYSQVYMMQAIKEQQLSQSNDFRITVVSNNLQDVTGEEVLCAEKAPVIGPAKVIPQEFSNFFYRCIDVMMPQPGTWQHHRLIKQLLGEIARESLDTVIAYRNGRRWVQTFEPIRWDEEKIQNSTLLREKGVYLITGGLGGIGLILAKYLARRVQARLILTTRSCFPRPAEWEKWLSLHDEPEPVGSRIRDLLEIEAAGGVVLVCRADTANYQQMQEVIVKSEEKFGPLNGIFHAAGVTGEKSTHCPVELISGKDCEKQFKPKVYGLLVLETLLRGKNLDFCILMSSLSTVLGGLGFTAYAAANCFMDGFAQKQKQTNGQQWITVNWDGWKLQGEDELSILPKEGEIAFQRILACHGENQLVVSTSDLQQRIQQWIELESLRMDDQVSDLDNPKTGSLNFKARPNLSTPFEAPQNQLEHSIVGIWRNFFGFEKLGINDDFFELGGDSLKMMTVVSRMHKILNAEVPLTEFFNQPTIKGLAEYIKHPGISKRFSTIKLAEEKEFYTLSPAQKRLYILQELDKNSTGYNMNHTVLLEGKIDRLKLEETFKKLIRRHETLRTSIQLIEDEPVQVIKDEVAFAVEYYAAEDNEIKELIVGSFIRPFDLRIPPFFRAALIKIGEQKQICAIDMHHIITDGVSFSIFVNDFVALYQESPLPPLKLQYKDYSEWKNSLPEKENVKSQEEYWLKEFAGEIPVIKMPTDFPRPENRSYKGDFVLFSLGKELSKKVDELTRDTGTTRYMVLLSIYYILLYKYTRQEDLVVGSPIPGRRHTDLQHVMGIFVNMLAMRNRPCGYKRYREFLLEVKETALNAFENQDCQFDELVMKLGIQGNLNQNPLFDTVFEMRFKDNNNERTHHMKEGNRSPQDNINTSHYPLGHREAVFDLILWAVEYEDTITLRLTYSSALFKRTKVEKLTKHYIDILSQVVEDYDIELKGISISHGLLKLGSRSLQEAKGDFDF